MSLSRVPRECENGVKGVKDPRPMDASRCTATCAVLTAAPIGSSAAIDPTLP